MTQRKTKVKKNKRLKNVLISMCMLFGIVCFFPGTEKICQALGYIPGEIIEGVAYVINYDANGGTGGPGSVFTIVVDDNCEISTEEPTRENYVFMGWSGTADGDVEYHPGETYKISNHVTIYAVWKPAEEGNLQDTSGAWNLNLQTGELCIKENVSASGIAQSFPWDQYKYKIKKVTVTGNATSVTGIKDCINLKTVSLGTQLKKIGEEAFSGCTRLTSVTIPSSVTEIGYDAFADTGLTTITLPNSVYYVGPGAFEKCASLSTVQWSENAGIDVLMFRNSGLVTLTVPAGVTSISSDAFFGCKELKEINVTAGNENFFSDSGVLYEKASLTLRTYPAGKRDMSYSIPEGIKKIGTFAFRDGAKFEDISFPSTLTDIGTGVRDQSLMNKGSACKFCYCQYLANINVSSANQVFSSVNGVLFDKKQTRLIIYPSGKRNSSYEIPAGVTEIESNAFYGNNFLNKIIFPEKSSKGITLHSTAISECNYLIELYIPQSVTTINWIALGYNIDARTAVDTTLYEKYRTNLRIIGFTGSAAETYANENKFEFSAAHYISFANVLESYEKQMVVNGKSYGSLPTPVKEGYVFEGWYTKENDGELVTNKDIVNLSEDQILYAHWKKAEEKPEIQKQPQDCEQHGGDEAVFSVETNSESNKYQWYQAESQNADGVEIAGATENILKITADRENHGSFYYCKVSNSAGETVSNKAELRVYYNIIYHGNGVKIDLETQKKFFYESVNIYEDELVRNGYTFENWSENAMDDSTGKYLPGMTITTELKEDLDLYAVWRAKETDPETDPGTETEEPDQSTTDTETEPSDQPSTNPETEPSDQPSTNPETKPSDQPTTNPETKPSDQPSTNPETRPSEQPATNPTTEGKDPSSITPATEPTQQPSVTPSTEPVMQPTTPTAPASNEKKEITKIYKKNKKFSLGIKVSGKATYKSSNKKVVTTDKKGKVTIKGYGKATVTITQKGKKAQKIAISIIPSSVSVSAKSSKATQLLISWKRNKSVTGYQIQYSTGAEFEAGDTRTGKTKNNKLTKTSVKATSGTTYYVRVRTYKKASGGTVYSSWSKTKSVRVK